jgi:hypothetical protein
MHIWIIKEKWKKKKEDFFTPTWSIDYALGAPGMASPLHDA